MSWAVPSDIALVIVVVGVELLISWDRQSHPYWLSLPLVPLVIAVGFLPLIWRRRFPRWVFASTVVFSICVALSFSRFVPLLAVWVALYTVSARCSRGAASTAFIVAIIPVALNASSEWGSAAAELKSNAIVVSVVAGLLACLIAFGVGRWARWSVAQRNTIAEMAGSAAVALERSRIACDLHDVVAHSVSLMMLQAAGAEQVVRAEPDMAITALRHVDALGSQAIAELRRMLDLMMPHAGYPAEEQRLPAPENIDELVKDVRAAGIRVDFDVIGEPMELEKGAGVAAYRIVQEALTNAARYADRGSPVCVQVRWTSTLAEFSVINRVSEVSHSSLGPVSMGRGLLGMRQRALNVAGTVEVGLHRQGQFVVKFRLPLIPIANSTGASGSIAAHVH